MQVDVLEFPLVLGIVPLVLVVLVCWTECVHGGGPNERRARRRHFRARDASRGLRGTAYSAVALPEPCAPLERSELLRELLGNHGFRF